MPDKEKPEKKHVKGIPTIDRICLQLKAVDSSDPSKTKPDALPQKCADIVTALGPIFKALAEAPKPPPEYTGGSKYDAFSDLMDKLEGPLTLPSEPVDFENDESIEKAVTSIVSKTLGIDPATMSPPGDLKSAVKAKLMVNDDQQATTVIDYFRMRLLLGMKEQVNLEELKEAQAFERYIESLKKREEMAKKLAPKEGSEELAQAIATGTKLPPEQLKGMLEKATKLGNGVYASFDDQGKPFLTMTKFDEKAINTVIDALEDKSTITWHNIPSQHQDRVIQECAKRGKKCVFQNGTPPQLSEGLLSKSMPEPNAENYWSQWLNNIQDPQVSPGNALLPSAAAIKETSEILIQKIIEEDPKKLQSFWHDLCNSAPRPLEEGKVDLLKNTAKFFTPKQVQILAKTYTDKLNELEPKIAVLKVKLQPPTPPSPADQALLARYEQQKQDIEQEQERLSEARMASLVDTIKEKQEQAKDKTSKKQLPTAVAKYLEEYVGACVTQKKFLAKVMEALSFPDKEMKNKLITQYLHEAVKQGMTLEQIIPGLEKQDPDIKLNQVTNKFHIENIQALQQKLTAAKATQEAVPTQPKLSEMVETATKEYNDAIEKYKTFLNPDDDADKFTDEEKEQMRKEFEAAGLAENPDPKIQEITSLFDEDSQQEKPG